MKVSSQSDLQDISNTDHVCLTDDITITGEFDTIDTFSGCFNGQGYTISNLSNPFINTVTEQAKIKNISFKNSNTHIFTDNKGVLQSISTTNIHIHSTYLKDSVSS